ncbi:DUF2188 domain-containing protein [Cellulomonas sp. SLBN-39]|uniref:DUF2188 domain-containing protein n=1 Tax=Cellulomonas sp. SLBN-39 TaxID=2768446 RepID=UPI001C92C2D6|nr:DUF2188 domain-containing protein [Cellulomonas sp. SLBN-39]
MTTIEPPPDPSLSRQVGEAVVRPRRPSRSPVEPSWRRSRSRPSAGYQRRLHEWMAEVSEAINRLVLEPHGQDWASLETNDGFLDAIAHATGPGDRCPITGARGRARPTRWVLRRAAWIRASHAVVDGTRSEEVEAMTANRNVVPSPSGGWDVTGAGQRASAHADTQAEAIARAKQIVENAGGGEVSIHGRDGRVRAKDTVAPGNDPRQIPG